MKVVMPISMPIRQRRGAFPGLFGEHIEACIACLRWPLDAKRRCDNAKARGQKPVGDPVRQILREVETQIAAS